MTGSMAELKLVPLGGMGNVTQNMYVYEYDNEMLIVDCGIGFPTLAMPGVDVLIPDITYIKDKLEEGKEIVGMILTHGHDDHIGATPYILPELPEFPIFASPLTAGFTKNRMKDSGIERHITVVTDLKEYQVGQHFTLQAYRMTHSVPDTRHYLITTPEGSIYHGSDFKLDPAPVDGQLPDFEHIAQLADKHVLVVLVDCLRVERSEWTKSETAVGPAIERAMKDTQGKFIMTLMSSHIHRIQQTVDCAQKMNRKVVFVGRSVEQNVDVALLLEKLHIPVGMRVDKKHIGDYRDDQLCVIIAGSQGQEGSSLMRAVYGEHPVIQIKPDDKVVFSADAIPGNEIPYFEAIDELSRNGVTVVYPDVEPDIHQSGHASAPEQQELVGLIKPKFVMPIGGADRHRVLFLDKVAKKLGYSPSEVLLPMHGEVLGFREGHVRVADMITLKPQLVDGLGIGDVGPVVLSDRKAMSQAGIVVLVIPKSKGRLYPEEVTIVSRGFVFMKEADEVVQFLRKTTAEIIDELGQGAKEDEIKKAIEKRLGRRLYKVIQREPMIVPVIVEV